MKKNNELEFESDKVKAYVQQLQAENGLLSQANEQLKAQIELIKISNQTTIDNLKRELIDQEAETLKAGGIINYLEKTLAEIKDIAENISKLPISRPYDACILNKQIIQKIEELKV